VYLPWLIDHRSLELIKERSMLSLTQSVLIVPTTMAASLLFMVGLNRIWPVASRHTQNDLIGW
jgi:hypothetical protein